jgi:hypothetical protein
MEKIRSTGRISLANMKKKSTTHTATGTCALCKEKVVSTRGGHFVYCGCGESFLDQERFDAAYVRMGGYITDVVQTCPDGCNVSSHHDPRMAFSPVVQMQDTQDYVDGIKKTMDENLKS